ncbi:MAG: metalloregulator ArsR/SmtB family transcription factor [Pseudomonadota bacterium]
MPQRQAVAKELAEIFKAVGHADRIRMIEELRHGEKDVNSIAQTLQLPNPRVSQHLSLLRALRIVEERREGRRHIYHLIQPEIADWIVQGLAFVEGRMRALNAAAIDDARRLWTTPSDDTSPAETK